MPVNTPQVANVEDSDTFTIFASKTNQLISIVNGLPALGVGGIGRTGGTIDGGAEGVILQGNAGHLFIINRRGLAIGNYLADGEPNAPTGDISILQFGVSVSINVVSTLSEGTANLNLQGTGNSAIRFLESSTDGMIIGYDDEGAKLDIRQFTSGTETDRFTFTRGGNFGIGTNSPTYKLDVVGDIGVGDGSGPNRIFHNDNNITYLQFDTDNISLFAGDQQILNLVGTAGQKKVDIGQATVDIDTAIYWTDPTNPALFVRGSDGQVGIGTNSPSKALEVVGTFKASGLATIGSKLTIEGGGLAVEGGSATVLTGDLTVTAGTGLTHVHNLEIDGTLTDVTDSVGGDGDILSFDLGGGGVKWIPPSIGAGTGNPTFLGRWNAAGNLMETSSIVDKSPNIGINEIDPDQLLHLTHATDPQILIEESANEYIRLGIENGQATLGWDDNSTKEMRFGTFVSTGAGATFAQHMVIQSGGNVGIGKAPLIGFKLDVNGDVGIGFEGTDDPVRISHSRDDTTYLEFSKDAVLDQAKIVLVASGQKLIDVAGSGHKHVRFSGQGIDADFAFYWTGSGTSALFIRGSDGQVGISEEFPDQLLHLTHATDPQILIEESANEYIRLGIENGQATLGWDNDSTKEMRFGTFATQIAGTAFTQRMVIHSDGNVGIGGQTATPTQKFSVGGTNAQILLWENDTKFVRLGISPTTDMVLGWHAGDHMHFGVFDNPGADTQIDPYVSIKSGGNVGIGTPDPKTPLHVDNGTAAGTADGDGYFMIGDIDGGNMVFDATHIQGRVDGAFNDFGAGGTLVADIKINDLGGNIYLLGGSEQGTGLGGSAMYIGDNVWGEGGTHYLMTIRNSGGKVLIQKAVGATTLDVGGSIGADGFVHIRSDRTAIGWLTAVERGALRVTGGISTENNLFVKGEVHIGDPDGDGVKKALHEGSSLIEQQNIFIEQPADAATRVYVLDAKARYPYRIDEIFAKTISGTGKYTIRIEGTAVQFLAGVTEIAILLAGSDNSTFSSRFVTENDRVTLEFSDVSGLVDTEMSIQFTRTEMAPGPV